MRILIYYRKKNKWSTYIYRYLDILKTILLSAVCLKYKTMYLIFIIRDNSTIYFHQCRYWQVNHTCKRCLALRASSSARSTLDRFGSLRQQRHPLIKSGNLKFMSAPHGRPVRADHRHGRPARRKLYRLHGLLYAVKQHCTLFEIAVLCNTLKSLPIP